ncbi:hypothetical protein RFI_19773 [Reticulomyxa filosa]|uniref:Uncharacterized protein n=1 Tax=Reticulomyxa filosa TaxID=46433 RepID=X6MV74_RETFI|nr:hypothetical protein RFI_19773 [Reticulomyxa filosa]|eukprot:ETO17546.1 hypothetical protein RFI_19773 [Reticulomyxa filosa]
MKKIDPEVDPTVRSIAVSKNIKNIKTSPSPPPTEVVRGHTKKNSKIRHDSDSEDYEDMNKSPKAREAKEEPVPRGTKKKASLEASTIQVDYNLTIALDNMMLNQTMKMSELGDMYLSTQEHKTGVHDWHGMSKEEKENQFGLFSFFLSRRDRSQDDPNNAAGNSNANGNSNTNPNNSNSNNNNNRKKNDDQESVGKHSLDGHNDSDDSSLSSSCSVVNGVPNDLTFVDGGGEGDLAIWDDDDDIDDDDNGNGDDDDDDDNDDDDDDDDNDDDDDDDDNDTSDSAANSGEETAAAKRRKRKARLRKRKANQQRKKLKNKSIGYPNHLHVAAFPYQHMGMMKKEHMTIPQIEFWIEWMILQLPVVIFGKSYDKKTKHAMKWLSLYLSDELLDTFFTVVYLDLEGFDHKTMFDIEKRLFYKSSRRVLGVPAIFFLGEYIG